ncbi:MAG: hypothetical protein R8M45_11900, partial [Ghiorsea sp.]
EEPEACSFGFEARVISTRDDFGIKQVHVTSATTEKGDVFGFITNKEVWATYEDDIEMAVYHAEQQHLEAEPEPCGEGYHEAMA